MNLQHLQLPRPFNMPKMLDMNYSLLTQVFVVNRIHRENLMELLLFLVMTDKPIVKNGFGVYNMTGE